MILLRVTEKCSSSATCFSCMKPKHLCSMYISVNNKLCHLVIWNCYYGVCRTIKSVTTSVIYPDALQKKVEWLVKGLHYSTSQSNNEFYRHELLLPRRVLREFQLSCCRCLFRCVPRSVWAFLEQRHGWTLSYNTAINSDWVFWTIASVYHVGAILQPDWNQRMRMRNCDPFLDFFW